MERRSSAPLDLKIQRSLTACWRDGVAAQVMVGIIDNYLIPFGLLLGATNQQIGYLVAVPNLLSSFVQLGAVAAVQTIGSRLKLLLRGVFLQAAFLVPVGFLAVAHVSHKLLWL